VKRFLSNLPDGSSYYQTAKTLSRLGLLHEPPDLLGQSHDGNMFGVGN
jgi:hypothetical protein